MGGYFGKKYNLFFINGGNNDLIFFYCQGEDDWGHV